MITQRGPCVHMVKLKVHTRYEYTFSPTFIDGVEASNLRSPNTSCNQSLLAGPLMCRLQIASCTGFRPQRWRESFEAIV